MVHGKHAPLLIIRSHGSEMNNISDRESCIIDLQNNNERDIWGGYQCRISMPGIGQKQPCHCLCQGALKA